MKPKINLKFILQAALASFTVYFCMYAFRKPYTVAKFQEITYWGVDYKILLIIAQVLGYTLSKFLGIRLISGLKKNNRAWALLGLMGASEIFLLLFALLPKPLNIVTLFGNGMCLGMIWGIVYSYIEGRKASEILGVILCSSFIVSSGMVKSIGKYVMDVWNFTEYWMPFITGLIFIIPLALSVLALEKLSPPNEQDKLEKSERSPMTKEDRKLLLKRFSLPITLIVLFFTLLTATRDFRDNFARELWDALGYHDSVSVYSWSELPIAVLVLLILGTLGLVKNNYKAMWWYHALLVLGVVLIIASTLLFQFDMLNPVVWMMISGFGMYLCYVPFNGLYFDRMIATFQIKGNTSFLIYISDAFGYLGSILIMLYKNFGSSDLSWLNFFVGLAYMVALLGLFTSILVFQFLKKEHNKLSLSI